ncbi:MAG: ester cyclase [Chloroflexaceae bacterium]|nr:ester cyclase [Chloroflexaceae bacterium]
MSIAANKALLATLFEAINRGDFARLDDHPGFWETRQVVPPAHAIFHNWRTTLLHQIAEDNKVFSYGNIQMTHARPCAGVATTGTRVTIEIFSLDQVADGLVTEHNSSASWTSVFRQIGMAGFADWPLVPSRSLPPSNGYMAHGAGRLAHHKGVVHHLLQQTATGEAVAPYRGVDGLRYDFAVLRAAFPDLHYETTMQVAEGQLVGTRATMQGTHTNPLYTIEPSGRTLRWDHYSMAAVQDGQVVAALGLTDWNALLGQLGMFPALAAEVQG